MLSIRPIMVRLSALLLLLILLVSHSVTAVEARKDELRVGVSMRPHFQFINENGDFSGIDVELAKAIFEHAGFNVTFVALPWKRIVYQIEYGELDVALSAADSDERKEFAYFSNEYLRLGHTVFFTLKENQSKFDHLQSLAQLKGSDIKVGAIRGVSYSFEFDELKTKDWFNKHLFLFDSYERLLDLLLIHRVDAYLGSEFGQLSLINQRKLQDKVVPVFYLMSEYEAQTHIMYSKRSVPLDWVAQIDKSIREFRVSEDYKAILAKYQIATGLTARK